MKSHINIFSAGPDPIAYPAFLLRACINPLGCLASLQHKYGDIVHFHLANTHFFLVNKPEYIREVLVTHHQSFHKYPPSQHLAKLFGKGLIVEEGVSYRRRRHLIQPAFHRQKITDYAVSIIETTQQRSLQWEEGTILDIAQEMRYLTLTIIARIILGIDIEKEVSKICPLVDALLINYNPFGLLSLKNLLEAFVPSLQGRFEDSLAQLNDIVSRLIKNAQDTGPQSHNLLAILLHAHTDGANAFEMSAEQVHDEVLNILLAGYETIANALSWTWYLLARNPQIEARLSAELQRVLNGRLPMTVDIPNLHYTRMVLKEAMRLYPPVWAMARKSFANVSLGGYMLPPESVVIMSQYLVHRDARYHPNPLQFIPERWYEETSRDRPKYAYFPFGGGPFICIGEPLAWMEGMLVLAVLAQKWRVRLVSDKPVNMCPLQSLRPSKGINVQVHTRKD